MNGQPPPTLPPPSHPTPPAAVRYVTAEELAAAIAQVHGRIDDQAEIHQRRVGDLEHDHYKLSGERYSAIERGQVTTRTAVNELGLMVANRLSRTDQMLEMLLRERNLPIPPQLPLVPR